MLDADITEEPHREDASSDDEVLTDKLKQLDRELPCKELVQLPRPTYDKYLDAVYVQFENWMSWGGIRPPSRQEGDKVMNDPPCGAEFCVAEPPTRTRTAVSGRSRPSAESC